MGDWNVILDSKIDKAGRSDQRLDRYETSLIAFMARHDLVVWFRLVQPGREMWAWIDSSLSVRVRSYLD